MGFTPFSGGPKKPEVRAAPASPLRPVLARHGFHPIVSDRRSVQLRRHEQQGCSRKLDSSGIWRISAAIARKPARLRVAARDISTVSPSTDARAPPRLASRLATSRDLFFPEDQVPVLPKRKRPDCA